jgi:hypothetical protein
LEQDNPPLDNTFVAPFEHLLRQQIKVDRVSGLFPASMTTVDIGHPLPVPTTQPPQQAGGQHKKSSQRPHTASKARGNKPQKQRPRHGKGFQPLPQKIVHKVPSQRPRRTRELVLILQDQLMQCVTMRISSSCQWI